MIQISLRKLLVGVAVVAAAIVSLRYASGLWVTLMAAATMVLFFRAVIVTVLDHGPRRAFAIGFAILMGSYAYLVHNAAPIENVVGNPELSPFWGRLPTTQLLRPLYGWLEEGKWVNSETGKELPDFDPSKTPQQIRVVGSRGFPVETYVESPAQDKFMRVGQFWWALLLGYAAGGFAVMVYRRRSREEQKLRTETS